MRRVAHYEALNSMAYDKSASRRAVNLSLNEDLLIRAKAATRSLSATVEDPLARLVQEDQARKPAEDQQLAAVITAVNAVHAEHGYLRMNFPASERPSQCLSLR